MRRTARARRGPRHASTGRELRARQREARTAASPGATHLEHKAVDADGHRPDENGVQHLVVLGALGGANVNDLPLKVCPGAPAGRAIGRRAVNAWSAQGHGTARTGAGVPSLSCPVQSKVISKRKGARNGAGLSSTTTFFTSMYAMAARR